MAMPIPKIIEEAKRQGLQIRWVEPDDCNYDQSRSIANARFSHRPAAIAYCESADSVAALFRIFKGQAPKIRIRSGGHQHEGMCSANEVLLVDLSELNRIGWDPETEQYQKFPRHLKELWIQPGAYLGDVYYKLEACWKTLPAGGCFHVNVGGLVQGGGWGPSLRKFGLTCDNLLEAEVVLANGDKVFASATENKKLYWAIRGGGGGNFGVITNCKFRIHPLAETMTTFTLRWARKHRVELVRTWMEQQKEMPDGLTTFGRIPVIQEKGEKEVAFLIGGQFYGTKEELQDHLQPFRRIAEPIKEKNQYRERKSPPKSGPNAGVAAGATEETAGVGESLTSLLAELVADLQPEAPASVAKGDEEKAPTSTCSGHDSEFKPHPHKVSSAFPKTHGDYSQLAEALVEVVKGTDYDEKVNRYVSLHGFGGAVAKTPTGATAFPYRDKEFMLQFQAWWSAWASREDSESYVRWIEDFRKNLDGVEGAFINFPDISLVPDKGKDRVELLQHYYAGNLVALREVKAEFDPDNVFSFGMSIPLP